MSTLDLITRSRDQVLSGEPLSSQAALELLDLAGPDVMDLLAAANRVRHQFKGDRVHLCSVINAKSGRCTENCGFCAQSVHHHVEVPTYPLFSEEQMFDAAQRIALSGAHAVGIVTSGLSPTDAELDSICRVVARIRRELTIRPDASLGMLTPESARKLKTAGLVGYHHNVETAESFFPRVCTTHSYRDHLETLRIAKETGFRVCSGGVFGLGETHAHWVEMARTLSEVRPDRVCMNFLMPVPGTPLAGTRPPAAIEILKLVAVYRLMLPTLDINICAGRDLHLGPLQGLVFLAGANATMIGNFLTQAGRPPEEDLKLLRQLGFTVQPDPPVRPS